MCFHSYKSSEVDECMSYIEYWNYLTVHARGLTHDLIIMRYVCSMVI